MHANLCLLYDAQDTRGTVYSLRAVHRNEQEPAYGQHCLGGEAESSAGSLDTSRSRLTFRES
jgi:hypothetical protein